MCAESAVEHQQTKPNLQLISHGTPVDSSILHHKVQQHLVLLGCPSRRVDGRVSGVLPEQLTAQRAALTFKLHTQTAITGFNHSASADGHRPSKFNIWVGMGLGIKCGYGWSCGKFVTPCRPLCFNSHFPGEPGLAGVYWSKGWWKWWWQLDYWSYKSRKAPVKSSPPTNQHPVFLQAGCPSYRPTNSVKALKGKYHIPWTCLPKLTWGLPTLSLTINSSWLPWGRVAIPLISPLMPVPLLLNFHYSFIYLLCNTCAAQCYKIKKQTNRVYNAKQTGYPDCAFKFGPECKLNSI